MQLPECKTLREIDEEKRQRGQDDPESTSSLGTSSPLQCW